MPIAIVDLLRRPRGPAVALRWREEHLSREIVGACGEHRSLRARKVRPALNRERVSVAHSTIERLMRALGLTGARRLCRVRSTRTDHPAPGLTPSRRPNSAAGTTTPMAGSRRLRTRPHQGGGCPRVAPRRAASAAGVMAETKVGLSSGRRVRLASAASCRPSPRPPVRRRKLGLRHSPDSPRSPSAASGGPSAVARAPPRTR